MRGRRVRGGRSRGSVGYHSRASCHRCGRPVHYVKQCHFEWHADGTKLKDEPPAPKPKPSTPNTNNKDPKKYDPSKKIITSGPTLEQERQAKLRSGMYQTNNAKHYCSCLYYTYMYIPRGLNFQNTETVNDSNNKSHAQSINDDTDSTSTTRRLINDLRSKPKGITKQKRYEHRQMTKRIKYYRFLSKTIPCKLHQEKLS